MSAHYRVVQRLKPITNSFAPAKPRWLNKSPNLGNVPHKQGEVTANLWAETHIVSGIPSLEMIFAAIMTYLCQKGSSIE